MRPNLKIIPRKEYPEGGGVYPPIYPKVKIAQGTGQIYITRTLHCNKYPEHKSKGTLKYHSHFM